jgi:hypothetical protein
MDAVRHAVGVADPHFGGTGAPPVRPRLSTGHSARQDGRQCHEPFRVADRCTRLCLKRDGAPVALTPKLFDLLVALVERGGHLVEKEALLNKVWPDVAVEGQPEDCWPVRHLHDVQQSGLLAVP